MSVGPMGALPASIAGLPTVQAREGNADRVAQELAARQRQSYYEGKADVAAGVGETDGENHETADRDADGRMEWEPPPAVRQHGPHVTPNSKDATGQSGTLLDLTG
jgi:hypothetical protein